MLFDDEELNNGSSVPPPPPFQANKTPYQDIGVDTQYIPLSRLMTLIEGKRWVVDYYSQVLNEDNETSALQTSRFAVNQQYRKISKYELKVITPIPVNPQFNAESQEFTVEGESNLYPGLRPNQGDMFIGTLLDGRKAVFQISDNPETMSIYLQQTYRIRYTMRSWLTEEIYKNLENKVVQRYNFIASFLDSGSNPVISDEAHGAYEKLREWQKSIPLYYLNKFYNQEYNTLIIPGQGNNIIYDPFLTTFVSYIWANMNIGPFHGMNFLNVMDNSIREFKTFFLAILTGQETFLDIVITKIPVVNSWSFLTNPYLQGASFLGVPFVVYPSSQEYYGPGGAGSVKPVAVSLKPSGKTSRNVRYTMNQMFPDSFLSGQYNDTDYSVIKPVTIDDYYILSEDFYAERPENLSLLETLVTNAINLQQVEATALLDLFTASRNWNDLEQFYYLPIICSLIPYANRGLPS